MIQKIAVSTGLLQVEPNYPLPNIIIMNKNYKCVANTKKGCLAAFNHTIILNAVYHYIFSFVCPQSVLPVLDWSAWPLIVSIGC